MGDLLLELLSEEIPARMQRRAIEEFAALVRDKLAAAEIPAQTLRGYVTPRRLALIADGIPGQQPDRSASYTLRASRSFPNAPALRAAAKNLRD